MSDMGYVLILADCGVAETVVVLRQAMHASARSFMTAQLR
jgi:hypothetical protein